MDLFANSVRIVADSLDDPELTCAAILASYAANLVATFNPQPTAPVAVGGCRSAYR